MSERNELNLDNLGDVVGGASAEKKSELHFDFNLGDHVEIHTKKPLFHQYTSGGTIKKRAYCRSDDGSRFFDGYYVECADDWTGWYSGDELHSSAKTWSKIGTKNIFQIKDQM